MQRSRDFKEVNIHLSSMFKGIAISAVNYHIWHVMYANALLLNAHILGFCP